MKSLKLCLLFSLCLLLFTGCQVSSRASLKGDTGRNAYNTNLQITTSEQMLLNLVRLRYLDAPYFLDVTNVTTQFTQSSKLSPTIPIPGFNQGNPFTLGGEFMYQNQPTIQYTPLEGQAFANQLMRPIDLEVLQRLIFSGWEIDLVFQLMVQSFDELKNANIAGVVPEFDPDYAKFEKATNLMRALQKRGELAVGVSHDTQKATTVNCPSQTPNNLQIIFSNTSEEGKKLASLLTGLDNGNGKYILDMNLGFEKGASIGIIPRSILGCMYYLSMGVNVPQRDYDNRVVYSPKSQSGEEVEWANILLDMIHIYHSRRYPEHAYVAIKYRDHWFFIDDQDLTSKKTFMLLLQLYNLQSTRITQPPPLLSIPLG